MKYLNERGIETEISEGAWKLLSEKTKAKFTPMDGSEQPLEVQTIKASNPPVLQKKTLGVVPVEKNIENKEIDPDEYSKYLQWKESQNKGEVDEITGNPVEAFIEGSEPKFEPLPEDNSKEKVSKPINKGGRPKRK
jgi:hypothetical protein